MIRFHRVSNGFTWKWNHSTESETIEHLERDIIIAPVLLNNVLCKSISGYIPLAIKRPVLAKVSSRDVIPSVHTVWKIRKALRKIRCDASDIYVYILPLVSCFAEYMEHSVLIVSDFIYLITKFIMKSQCKQITGTVQKQFRFCVQIVCCIVIFTLYFILVFVSNGAKAIYYIIRQVKTFMKME